MGLLGECKAVLITAIHDVQMKSKENLDEDFHAMIAVD